ncbi:MAG: zinc-ribbon domain-containing protein [Lachnospiraceae bacterium]|nr:zinc-ribbon domain-containing protein [Lachnospiraceae bacterium]
MKICPACNYENPDTNKFCNYCGAQLSGVEPTGGTAPEPDPLAEILAKQKEAAEAQNPVGIGAAGAAGAGIYGAAGQRGQQPGQQGGFQPGAQNGFQAAGQGGYQPGARPAGRHVYRQMGQGGRPMAPNNNAQQYTYSPTPFDSKIPEIAIGKYVAWSVFDILFSLIFGILGLIFVLRINKSKTVEEQQKNLKTARIFLIIGTVFAILNIVFMIAGGLA